MEQPHFAKIAELTTLMADSFKKMREATAATLKMIAVERARPMRSKRRIRDGLHPTKGWRCDGARPSGTNRRRCRFA